MSYGESGVKEGISAELYFKPEYFNPAGSVKDRIGYSMIAEAEDKGVLKKGAAIIEPTGGNTGVALAFVASAEGYALILTMPSLCMKNCRKNCPTCP